MTLEEGLLFQGVGMAAKVQWLRRDILQLSMFYTLCLTAEQYDTAQRHLRIPKANRDAFIERDARCTFYTNDDKTSAVVQMVVPKDAKLASIHAMLVHEAVHIWQRHLQIIGEDKPSSEFEAYAMQGICLFLFDAYDRMKS